MSYYLSYVLKSKTTFWDIITGKKVNLYVPIPDIFQILELNQPKWRKALMGPLSHLPIVIRQLAMLSQKLHLMLR